jgi:hypothetical protein
VAVHGAVGYGRAWGADEVSIFRLYGPDELGKDGYPPEWHRLGEGHDDDLDMADEVLPGCYIGIKHIVRKLAGNRCVRCKHPYRPGFNVSDRGEWSACDTRCEHGMPARDLNHPFESLGLNTTTGGLMRDGHGYRTIEAQWRILTVHHLDGNKLNCRWWNLVALCQRCHLEIQGKVKMERRWLGEHSVWFRPYVAGFYAFDRLGEDLSRTEVEARLDELLGLEDRQLELEPDSAA